MAWTIENFLEEQRRLLNPGVIGFYESFEVTEILGFEKDGTATNFFSLIVAEPGLPPEGPVKLECLTAERIEIKGCDYKFGVFRFRVATQFFMDVLERFAKTGTWQTGPKPLKVGTLVPVVPQFVPPDFNDPHPWNGVLKNNFYEGSHVFELFDTTKDAARFLLRDSRLLADLSARIRSFVHMDIDGLSDRLGNVVIQLPVTVISTGVRGSPVGDQSVRVAWHEKATPRPLRISCEIYNDSTVDAFDSKMVSALPAREEDSIFRLRSPGGGARTYVWDDSNQVLLSASPVQTFLLRVGVSMHAMSIDAPGDPKRTFSTPIKGAAAQSQEIELKRVEKPNYVGSTPERPREPWRSERIFKLSLRKLRERKEFVQYGQYTGLSREDAMADVRWLLETHGALGAWLWDPFLNAKDVLQTLFFSPHRDSDLRALSNGKTFESPDDGEEDDNDGQADCVSESNLGCVKAELNVDRSLTWKNEQREELEAHRGNCHGLKLEFRLRRKGAGWRFHDRFLIFPQEDGRALAWSLGTSVNSLGSSHHILQKVSNGELVQNAFLSLWDCLESEPYVVWKVGK